MSSTVTKFWEIEEFPKSDVCQIKPGDRSSVEKMQSTMKFKNGHYEVSIPWRETKTELPKNYGHSLHRLENTTPFKESRNC